MHTFPHRYHAKASGRAFGDIELTAARLPILRSASPAEFDGPGDRWSPETLLVGAVADCFILTFRAIATASKLAWVSLECNVAGTLEPVDRVTQFTRFDVTAHLVIALREDADRARRALQKAERSCLISNSLKGSIDLNATVSIGEPLELEVSVP
jgi:peroxiredoxin-like protein